MRPTDSRCPRSQTRFAPSRKKLSAINTFLPKPILKINIPAAAELHSTFARRSCGIISLWRTIGPAINWREKAHITRIIEQRHTLQITVFEVIDKKRNLLEGKKANSEREERDGEVHCRLIKLQQIEKQKTNILKGTSITGD